MRDRSVKLRLILDKDSVELFISEGERAGLTGLKRTGSDAGLRKGGSGYEDRI